MFINGCWKYKKFVLLKSENAGITCTVTIVGFDCTLFTLQWLTVYIKWLLEIHLNYTEKTNKVNDCNFYSGNLCSVEIYSA